MSAFYNLIVYSTLTIPFLNVSNVTSIPRISLSLFSTVSLLVPSISFKVFLASSSFLNLKSSHIAAVSNNFLYISYDF